MVEFGDEVEDGIGVGGQNDKVKCRRHDVVK